MDATDLASLLRQPAPTYAAYVTTTFTSVVAGSTGQMRTTVVTRTLNATLALPSNSASAQSSRSANASRFPASASASASPALDATTVAAAQATATQTEPIATPTPPTSANTANNSAGDDDDSTFLNLPPGKSSDSALGYLAFIMLAVFVIGGGLYFFSRRRRKAMKSSRLRRGRTALRRDVELGRWRVATLWRSHARARSGSGASADPLPEYQGKLPTYREMVQEVRAPPALGVVRESSPPHSRDQHGRTPSRNSHLAARYARYEGESEDTGSDAGQTATSTTASMFDESTSAIAGHSAAAATASGAVSPQTTGSAPSFAAVTLARLHGDNTGSTTSSASAGPSRRP